MISVNNVETLVYALNKSHLQLEDVLPSLGENRKEVYYYVSETISRIINCYDRVKNLDSKEFDFLIALKFVNNCLKHNPSLQFFHSEIHEATTIPIKLDGKDKDVIHIWDSLDKVEIVGRQKDISIKQREAYKKYLKGKEILYTLRYYVNRINTTHMKCEGVVDLKIYIWKSIIEGDWSTVLLGKQ